MARPIAVQSNQHRSRLALWSFLALIAAIVLPLGLALPLGASRYEFRDAQPLEVATVQSDQGPERGDCWQSTAHTREKSVLGLTVLDLRHEVQWCSDGQEVTVLASKAWMDRSFFGSWTLVGESRRVEQKNQGAYLLVIYQDLTYKDGYSSSSYSHCLELDLHTNGRAEGRQC